MSGTAVCPKISGNRGFCSWQLPSDLMMCSNVKRGNHFFKRHITSKVGPLMVYQHAGGYGGIAGIRGMLYSDGFVRGGYLNLVDALDNRQLDFGESCLLTEPDSCDHSDNITLILARRSTPNCHSLFVCGITCHVPILDNASPPKFNW